MRYEPCVLPSVSFAIVIRTVSRCERTVLLAEIALAVFSAEELKLVIEKIYIRLASVEEMLIFILFSEHLGCIGKCAVSKSVFEVVCNRFAEEVAWDVAILHAEFLSSVRFDCRILHRLECKFVVESFESLHDGVSHRRNAGVSYHTVCLAAVQVPYRKLALLLVYVEHCIDEINISVALEDAVQWHCSPVCVPEGECGICRMSRIFVYLAVCASV